MNSYETFFNTYLRLFESMNSQRKEDAMEAKQTVRCNECAYRDGETCQLLYQEEHDRRYGFALGTYRIRVSDFDSCSFGKKGPKEFVGQTPGEAERAMADAAIDSIAERLDNETEMHGADSEEARFLEIALEYWKGKRDGV